MLPGSALNVSSAAVRYNCFALVGCARGAVTVDVPPTNLDGAFADDEATRCVLLFVQNARFIAL